MSRKKKGLALWLALFLGVSSLTGCGSGNDNMTQLSQKGADIMNSSDEEQDTDVELLKQDAAPEVGLSPRRRWRPLREKMRSFILWEKQTVVLDINGPTMEARFRIL